MSDKTTSQSPIDPSLFKEKPFQHIIDIGINRRDYFAGLAMNELLTSRFGYMDSQAEEVMKIIAQLAVKSADFLIEELDKAKL